MGGGHGRYRGGDGSVLLEPVPVPDDGGGGLGAARSARQVVGCPRAQQDLGGSVDGGVLGGDCRGDRGRTGDTGDTMGTPGTQWGHWGHTGDTGGTLGTPGALHKCQAEELKPGFETDLLGLGSWGEGNRGGLAGSCCAEGGAGLLANTPGCWLGAGGMADGDPPILGPSALCEPHTEGGTQGDPLSSAGVGGGPPRAQLGAPSHSSHPRAFYLLPF